ncbi:MAG: hypothetical protein FWD57_10565, partial [Polyangiaceae bacterium]|nr:hypothetical protein [Polyangiaceae bacterium]
IASVHFVFRWVGRLWLVGVVWLVRWVSSVCGCDESHPYTLCFVGLVGFGWLVVWLAGFGWCGGGGGSS